MTYSAIRLHLIYEASLYHLVSLALIARGDTVGWLMLIFVVLLFALFLAFLRSKIRDCQSLNYYCPAWIWWSSIVPVAGGIFVLVLILGSNQEANSAVVTSPKSSLRTCKKCGQNILIPQQGRIVDDEVICGSCLKPKNEKEDQNGKARKGQKNE